MLKTIWLFWIAQEEQVYGILFSQRPQLPSDGGVYAEWCSHSESSFVFEGSGRFAEKLSASRD